MMMMNEVKTIRCKIDKNLAFEKLCQRLDEQLEQNVAEGTIRLTPERDGTITVTYRNRAEADAKHIVKMVCDMVDISEAKARGQWTAQYSPVKIEWLSEFDPHEAPT